jgi:hypothetical protein
MTDKHYYCTSLSGECSYNTCINSDLTVSCNCNDDNGSGQIGDLNLDSFESIWKDENKGAQKFRNLLSIGVLPTQQCLGCHSLKVVDKETALQKSSINNYTEGLMIENGIACNFLCKCPRYNLPNVRKKPKMNLNETEVVAKLCNSLNLKNIYYFNLNEPFASNTILQELELIRTYNPTAKIYISTNVSLINNENARNAALIVDELICSIDGSSQEKAELYQVKTKFNIVIDNLKRLIELKNKLNKSTIINWKYVSFTWNDDEIEIDRAIEMAKSIGCDKISFCIGYTSDGTKSDLFDKLFFKNKKTIDEGYYKVIYFK